MPPLNRAGPTFAYLAAGLIGVVFTAILLTWPEIAGTGGIWLAPQGDLAENLAGHLAFQASPWQWPLLKASNIFVPTGLSIAMTDSNPLVSLLGKLFVTITGRPPQNDFGYWCALCYTLQPIAAVYAIRGLAIRRPETALAAALFAISFPAFLFRYGHVNLLGHFWLLLALGIALRDARRVVAPRALIRFALLVGAELSHPYLFVFCGLTAIHRLLEHSVPGRKLAAGIKHLPASGLRRTCRLFCAERHVRPVFDRVWVLFNEPAIPILA